VGLADSPQPCCCSGEWHHHGDVFVGLLKM
jgi:hypothetical protein